LTGGGLGSLSSNSPLTVDGSTAVFDLGANHNNTVNTVILDGGGSITGTGTSTLSSPFYDFRNGTVTAGLAGAATPLVKSTSGVITLSGSDTYTGGTNVSAGSLILNASAAFPTNSSLTVASGAFVTIANHSTNTTYVPQLSALTNSGTIDVVNNAFLIHNSSAAVGTINTEVAQAFANGAWTGTNSSSGVITSSMAAADTTHLTAVGVATGITTFQGSTVLATDVLVKYTYYGDANLDGKVDGSDYSLIDSGYATGATGWENGDFNYDGVINGSDYTLIDNAFNTQGTKIAEEVATATAEIAGTSSAVPEPTTLSLLGIGTLGLLGRRRRSR
jgi:autotransporter-associated beta strand protein